MKKEKSSAMGTPYTFEGRIPLKQAIPLGLQHVMAMFVGNLTPLLIIMGACGLTADAGYTREQIGKINVTEFTTFVAVNRDIALQAMQKLNAGKVKGKSVKVRLL